MNRAGREGIGALSARAELDVDGVLVVGMSDSGIEPMGRALAALGLTLLTEKVGIGGAQRLSKLNDDLMMAGGGTGSLPPPPAPSELAHTLSEYAGHALETLAGSLPSGVRVAPWVWADPRLSFLAPFWSEALGARIAVVLVHRDPDAVVRAAEAAAEDQSAAAIWWDRSNRAALVLSSRFPSLVINYDDVARRPKEVVGAVADFLKGFGFGLNGDVNAAAAELESLEPDASGLDPVSGVQPDQRTLHRVISQLDAQVDSGGSTGSLVSATAGFYDEDYYGVSYDKSGIPYSRQERIWVDLMDRVARDIVESLRPRTALDVGCALGLLVESLRKRGVDARGIDISRWAIEQVPADLKPYCDVGSLTDEISGSYDLITCIEVLEHLPPSLAEPCVANLCRHAEMVLFSSTPDDYDEPTHLNVEPSGYWANLFLRHGFLHVADFDASFIAPHAMLFRRGEAELENLVDSYERALWDTRQLLGGALREQQREAVRLEEEVRFSQQRRAAENMAAAEAIREIESGQDRLAGLLAFRESELIQLYETKTFRYTAKARSLYARLRGRGADIVPGLAPVPPQLPRLSYQRWVELYDTLDENLRRSFERGVQALPERPLISVMMPVYNPPIDMLSAAIDSVQKQIYPDWELCIADDCSPDPRVCDVLAEYAASEPRIRYVRRAENGHISAASNSALSLASGSWVALLDHDDIIREHALALVAQAIVDHPEAGLIYSDEDKLEGGTRKDPYFKPDFDPLLLLGQNCVSHLGVFRRDLVEQVGGYRVGYEGSQDWDLTLRVSELLEERQVVHIPHVLYHWRAHASSTASVVEAKPYAIEAGRLAVTDHLERTNRPARVIRIGQVGFNRVVWGLPGDPPKVTIVIPTRDGERLNRCLDSVLSLTAYPDFDVIVVDNGSRLRYTLSYLEANAHRIKLIRDERPFSHSGLNNAAVERASGDVICLLNDDTEVITGEWLMEMVRQLMQPGVGAVGAKLYFGDGRVQHAGTILGIHGVAGHAHTGADRLSHGYFGRLQLAHRMSAVTAACMAVRREAWDQVRGFDEDHLPVVLNDVDLCLRLAEAGWDIVWTPQAELFHHESTSRGSDDPSAFNAASEYMRRRWGTATLRNDPYYNPNLSLDAQDYSLAWPPRAPYFSNE